MVCVMKFGKHGDGLRLRSRIVSYAVDEGKSPAEQLCGFDSHHKST